MTFVEGSYATRQEVITAVKRLKAEGYKEKNIRLISNEEVQNTFMDQPNIDIMTDSDYLQDTDQAGDRDVLSILERMFVAPYIKEDFSPDDHADRSTITEDDPLYAYQGDIEIGNIVIIVEGKPKTAPIAGKDTSATQDKDIGDEKTIQLKEEELDVDKKNVQTGEVHVSKRVVQETEKVEVPVEHEEVTIEKRPVEPSEKVKRKMNMDDEEVTIPVKEEQIEVTKKPVVTEEVKISKETVKNTEQVKELVEKEELDMDTDGDVKVDKKNTKKHK